MRVARSGRARVSIKSPRNIGECDLCGLWVNHMSMSVQRQWAGNSLVDTGSLVCSECLDKPQDQYRTIILPQDPVPIRNARVSGNTTPIPFIGQPLTTTPANLGFTQYTLGAAGTPGLWPNLSQAAILAAVFALSGVSVATPITLAQNLTGNVSLPLLLADPTRTFVLIYNPTAAAVQISLSATTVPGAITNLSIGPAEAFFWSTAQGLGTVYQGAISAVSPYGGSLPLWIWTDSTVSVGFFNNSGLLAFINFGASSGWPASPLGLTAGALWSNTLLVSCVGPTAPNIAAPPIYFNLISPAVLLATGGADLPLTLPTLGSGQLWNSGGLVAVA